MTIFPISSLNHFLTNSSGNFKESWAGGDCRMKIVWTKAWLLGECWITGMDKGNFVRLVLWRPVVMLFVIRPLNKEGILGLPFWDSEYVNAEVSLPNWCFQRNSEVQYLCSLDEESPCIGGLFYFLSLYFFSTSFQCINIIDSLLHYTLWYYKVIKTTIWVHDGKHHDPGKLTLGNASFKLINCPNFTRSKRVIRPRSIGITMN